MGRPTSRCFGDTVLVLFCQMKNEMQSSVAFDTFLLLPWAQLPCLQQQDEGLQICFTGLIQDSIKTVFPNGAVTSHPVPCAECPVGEYRGLSMFLKLRCHSRVLVPPSCWEQGWLPGTSVSPPAGEEGRGVQNRCPASPGVCRGCCTGPI
ncbi:hypothetical protein mRhiFer1_009676 [Rhinolophus ferrumequinum]|uniref:Uncharacterized protein n=1 Tax=Rhinolophus ferrumequinum TaxID=59479 RepID=A0A7J7R2T3_RHIFE|nr:hypothetical protein mRhiFer1_009676 [Rhinolophus ferrumequinum]